MFMYNYINETIIVYVSEYNILCWGYQIKHILIEIIIKMMSLMLFYNVYNNTKLNKS